LLGEYDPPDFPHPRKPQEQWQFYLHVKAHVFTAVELLALAHNEGYCGDIKNNAISKRGA
jgi:hypothetical protein